MTSIAVWDSDLVVNVDGYLSCDEWRVLTPAELAAEIDVVVLADLYDLLNAAFTTPSGSTLAGAFMACLTVPMIAYLTAWGYGKVIHFAESNHTDV